VGGSCLLSLLCKDRQRRKQNQAGSAGREWERAAWEGSHARHCASAWGYSGATGDILSVLKVGVIKKLVSLLILCLLYLVSDIVTRTGLFTNRWEFGESEMLWFKAVCFGFDFPGLLTD